MKITDEEKAASAAAQLRKAADWVEQHPQYVPYVMMVHKDAKISLYGYNSGLQEMIPWDKTTITQIDGYGYANVSWEEDGQALSANVKPPPEVARARRIAQLREELTTLEAPSAPDHG